MNMFEGKQVMFEMAPDRLSFDYKCFVWFHLNQLKKRSQRLADVGC